jgi:hypothetical protein
MARWHEIELAHPALAAAARTALDAHKHKVMATLRADGSPRVSGTELDCALGEMWLGSMTGAVKARDLQRDPRIAIHACTADATMANGDVKLAGLAVEITDPAEMERYVAARSDAGGEPVPDEPFHLFRLDVREVVRTSLGGDPPDHLVIEVWTQDGGLRRIERR